jgi:hypothetical protein
MSWLLSTVGRGFPPPKFDQGSWLVPVARGEPLLATIISGLRQSLYCVVGLGGMQSPGLFAVER